MMGVSLLGGLCSPSAFAMNQGGDAIAQLVLLGVAGLGAIATISYKEWKSYEEHKHKEQIEAVNKLHNIHLKNLWVSSASDVKLQGFPLIFQWRADGKTVDSLHYNDEEINDIGSVPPNVPLGLTSYQHKILDAIKKLKAYYFSDKVDDITKGVLSYLMNYLQNRCLNFLGYDYDIVYLKALIAFIVDYASLDQSENNPHFSYLKEVYTPLMYAQQDLEKHKKTLSLQDRVNEVRRCCFNESEKLIRLLASMIIPEEYQNIIPTVTDNELQNDILRKKYTDKEIFGIPVKNKKKIELPDGIFHQWLSGLAKYYLQSQNPRGILAGEKILLPEELFTFVTWARALKKQRNPRKEEQRELEKQLNLIHHLFKKSPNFINTKLDWRSDDPKFVVINSDEELLAATEAMAHFGHLIHGIISLQVLCTELQSSIEELGLMFFDNQKNFHDLFASLESLYTVVQKDLTFMRERMTAIKVANKNTLRLAEKIKFESAVEQALNNIEGDILRLTKNVLEYKNAHPVTVEEVKKEVISVGLFLQKMYGIFPKESLIPKENQGVVVEEAVAKPPEIPATSQPTLVEMEVELNDLQTDLSIVLNAIHSERLEDSLYKQYLSLSESLREVKVHCISMLNEQNQTADRQDKAKNLYALTHTLYMETLEFLSQPVGQRTQELASFIQKIDEQLLRSEHRAFIERHQSALGKFVYENFGFFKTKTKVQLEAVEQTGHALLTESSALKG